MCCEEYQQAWREGRIIEMDGLLYFDENVVITRCPFCNVKFNR
jgi:hypothetical protein